MHSNNMQKLNPIVREMETSDLPMVFALEEICHDFDGWPQNLFNDCLIAGYPSFVVEHDSYICGFIVSSIGADEMQILNIKVDPEFRHQGIASSLLAACVELAKVRDCYRITLEVRISNLPAQLLYEKFSFIKDGCRKDYYSAANATREDALLYSLQLKD
jgi:ribosomal-protein-alanine N-acetyltransferase